MTAAAVTAARTLAVVAETCTTLPRLPGVSAPPATATTAGGSFLPRHVAGNTFGDSGAPSYGNGCGGVLSPHTAGNSPTNAFLGCFQVTSLVYDLRPDVSKILQQSDGW